MAQPEIGAITTVLNDQGQPWSTITYQRATLISTPGWVPLPFGSQWGSIPTQYRTTSSTGTSSGPVSTETGSVPSLTTSQPTSSGRYDKYLSAPECEPTPDPSLDNILRCPSICPEYYFGGDANGNMIAWCRKPLDKNEGLSSGAKAGIAVGAVFGALLIGLSVVIFRRKRRRRQTDDEGGNGSIHTAESLESAYIHRPELGGQGRFEIDGKAKLAELRDTGLVEVNGIGQPAELEGDCGTTDETPALPSQGDLQGNGAAKIPLTSSPELPDPGTTTAASTVSSPPAPTAEAVKAATSTSPVVSDTPKNREE